MNRELLTFLSVTVLSVSLAVSATACGSDNCKDKPMVAMAQHEEEWHPPQGKVDEDGKASGATMRIVFSAKDLYTCPMHPEVVTDNPEARCPLCGMNLDKMSDEDKTALLESKPKGCVMDPIVVPGDSETYFCAMCKMNLQEIPENEHSEHQH